MCHALSRTEKFLMLAFCLLSSSQCLLSFICLMGSLIFLPWNNVEVLWSGCISNEFDLSFAIFGIYRCCDSVFSLILFVLLSLKLQIGILFGKEIILDNIFGLAILFLFLLNWKFRNLLLCPL